MQTSWRSAAGRVALSMADDPRPELRCRCVSPLSMAEPDPYTERCMARATAEDGLCDECRSGPGDDPHVCPGGREPRYLLKDPLTPCLTATDVEDQ